MRKLIVQQWMSLDGFVTDKNGQLDFFSNLSPEANTYSDLDQLKFLDTIDTILLGRITYELFVDFWPTATTDKEVIADKLNSIDKIIFSHTLKEAPWGDWPAAQVITGEAAAAIRELKNQPGKNMVLWGSISLAQYLMKEKLVDEYHIQLCPVLTGGGRELFTEQASATRLQLKEMRKYDTGVVFVSYHVAR